MKQKDIALIIVIAAISAVVSYFLSSQIFVTPSNRAQQVEVVSPITSQFQKPSTKYFNDQSIDPTQLVPIGNQDNPNPFNGAGQ